MIFSIFQILVGLGLLYLGGEVLIRGAVAFAKRLGLSTFAIGLTVVAYGTSSPELVISLKAALDGYADISLGNIIGSNISNILCVLGATAIIYPVAIDKKLSLIDGLFMLAVTVLLAIFCFLGQIGQISGVIFLLVLVIYTFLVFKKARSSDDIVPEHQTEDKTEKLLNNKYIAFAACIIGTLILSAGGDVLIGGAVNLAKLAGWSEATIGVTIIAFGGSSPELFASIIAALHRKSDIIFGNIIGSNLFNILGIMGITGVVSPINVDEKFITFDIPILIAVTLITTIIIISQKSFSKLMGLIFFSGYIVYITFQFI